MGLRITTWNVNGIRNPFGYQPWSATRTFNAMFDILEADIVILQELKIQRKDLTDEMVLVPGWDCFFSLPKHKKGYSGVAIYTRQSVCAPIKAEEGILGVLSPTGTSTAYRDLPSDKSIGGYPSEAQIEELDINPAELDAEGRCVVVEFPAFVIFGVYSPANSNGLRDHFRYGFLAALDARIRNLDAMGKHVILTGDLNVSREEMDTAKAEESRRQEGLSHEEYISTPNRRIFNQLLEGGDVVGDRDEGRGKPVLWDICRGFHPSRTGMYTHWEQKINARPGNFGSRIDYVLCSVGMKAWVSAGDIQEGLFGSDHCPVYATFKDRVEHAGQEVFLTDIMNTPGIFKDGRRLREWGPKDRVPFSGRLLPEFDKRRSIKDMFSKKPSSNVSIPSPVRGPTSELSLAAPKDAVESPRSAEKASLERMSTQEETPLSTKVPNSASVTNTTNPHLKRKNPPSPVGTAAKKQATGAASKNVNGQKSLKGFFKPRNDAGQKKSLPEKTEDLDEATAVCLPASSCEEENVDLFTPNPDLKRPSADASASAAAKDPPKIPPLSPPTASPKSSPSTTTNTPSNHHFPPPPSPPVFDSVASKESWSRLFKKPPPPLCEGHDEPCISLTSKKKGFNCGRRFWICSKPVGPSGEKEVGTMWRCKTFIWASDWNGG
ncbi:apyrimidinic endonuclease [Aulographum hederae CBS 113979]|uniref:DNA-(apurinic or apyrimidinic site) endonuclease 2 n=1 Tax=Aulographum hederae CBS 113979 TaxID=1176131 RepID=A0A6G1GPM3_9PEZI|nr:apyrimidinic endonuclease [Aulographum hederae CBS 113979]